MVTLKPGGMLCVYDPSAAGYSVTNSSTDLINMANDGADTGVTYDVLIIGEV